MSASDIRESSRKITPKFAIILAALFLLLGAVQLKSDLTIAEILPFDPATVAYYSVETDSETDEPKHMQLGAKESAALMDHLGQLEFRTNGAASTLRFCYCRIFFVTDGGERAEIMLTDDMALVSHTTSEEKPKVYGVKPDTDALQAYIDSLFAK